MTYFQWVDVDSGQALMSSNSNATLHFRKSFDVDRVSLVEATSREEILNEIAGWKTFCIKGFVVLSGGNTYY